MAITATPKKFSMQQVFEILLRKPTDKSIVAYLEDTKTSNLNNTVEMVYPTGGRGNVYVGGGFSHSKRATLEVTVATWNTEVMAAQNGTEVATGETTVTEYEIVTPSNGTYTLKYAAEGATNAQIGYVYTYEDDGTFGTAYEQVATASLGAGKFAYATSSKTITFATADSVTSKIALSYTRKTTTAAQKITVNADAIPDTVLVTAYGMAKDICTGELYPAQVDGMAQIDGNYNFELSADGEPAVHSLNLEFVKGCTSKRLYDFIVYTDEVPT